MANWSPRAYFIYTLNLKGKDLKDMTKAFHDHVINKMILKKWEPYLLSGKITVREFLEYHSGLTQENSEN